MLDKKDLVSLMKTVAKADPSAPILIAIMVRISAMMH